MNAPITVNNLRISPLRTRLGVQGGLWFSPQDMRGRHGLAEDERGFCFVLKNPPCVPDGLRFTVGHNQQTGWVVVESHFLGLQVKHIGPVHSTLKEAAQTLNDHIASKYGDAMPIEIPTKTINVPFEIPADVDMASEDYRRLKEILLHAVGWFHESKGYYDGDAQDTKLVEAVLHES
jgi:hypothetical protein